MEQKTIKLFQRIAKIALRPLPNLTVSDWADRYRMLSSEASSEPGRWRTDRAPYQREIMNAFTQPRVWKVVVMSAAQIGKSDIMNNVIGRYSHLAPAPILMIQPTIDMAQDYSKSRIAPMIRDTKVLREIYRDVKTRESGNTILSKLFPGGRLIMGGANSPAGLASRPIKILLADEVDRFPDSAGTEGDPVDLAAKRMTTFWDRRMGIFSHAPCRFPGRFGICFERDALDIGSIRGKIKRSDTGWRTDLQDPFRLEIIDNPEKQLPMRTFDFTTYTRASFMHQLPSY